MDGVLKWFTGSGGMMIAIFLAGIVAGGWITGMAKDAGMVSEYRNSMTQNSKALVILVQNGGRREMNYIRTLETERAQCVATVEGFRDITLKSAEAQAAAIARGDQLQAAMRSQSARYQDLLKSYEAGDATTQQWMGTNLPDDVKRMRWGENCGPDLFSAAGYPGPPGDKCTVAKPPG